jgi:glycosidase
MPANPTSTQRSCERSLSEIDFSSLTKGRQYHPSPAAWEDQVLYFLLADRFSDGREYSGFGELDGNPVAGPTKERTTALFDLEKDAWKADREKWFEAGKTWCGGTLAGLTDKIGYLRRLGVTAVWLSPVFRQVTGSDTYHGYGIQNFLDVDPHFGTREELRDFVSAAHAAGIRVILDIILNHAGDVFAYQGGYRYYYFQGNQWPASGFRRDSTDPGTLPFSPLDAGTYPHAWPHSAIWPSEFQHATTWTKRGEIQGWDNYPEYLEGDFCTLKDIDHGSAPREIESWDLFRRINEFGETPALWHLANAYKFWIAYADIDGYRIDTVKHMEPGAVRFFVNVIHEFAQSLGKENFYLIGEVTGGRQNAVHIVDTTGIDAALGVDDIPGKLEFLAKGRESPGNPDTDDQEGYFDLFRNSVISYKDSHQWFGRHIVTLFDDHDQVSLGKRKFRFCGDPGEPNAYRYLIPALALNLTTAGIPCIYYGTEQAFNGADHRTSGEYEYSDVFLRECMFGGPFGSLQSQGRHFFNEDHEVYRFIRDVCTLRRDHLALRRGRQYLREVSATGAGGDFCYPQPIGGRLRWVVAWSRIFGEQEYLCAVNTDVNQSLKVWAAVDRQINPPGKQMSCLLSTEPALKGSVATVEGTDRSALPITVPPAGFVVYH